MRFESWLLVGATMVCTTVAAAGQSKPATATATIGARRIALEYVAVPAAEGPASTGVGGRWTFGGVAGALVLETPFLTDDAVISPGRYKVEIERRTDDAFVMKIVGGQIVRGAASAARDVELPVKVAALEQDSPRCTAAWTLVPRPKESDRTTATLEIRAGRAVYSVSGILLSPATRRASGAELDVWPLPATLLASRTADGLETPFFTLRRPDPRDKSRTAVQNLCVVGDKAILASAPLGPDAAGVVDPNAKEAYELTLEWKSVKETSPTLTVPFFELKKDIGFSFRLAQGSRVCQFFTRDPLFDLKNKR